MLYTCRSEFCLPSSITIAKDAWSADVARDTMQYDHGPQKTVDAYEGKMRGDGKMHASRRRIQTDQDCTPHRVVMEEPG